MKGSTVAGINPVKLGGAGRGTTVAGLGTKGVGAMKAKLAPNQNIKLKSRKGDYSGVVQGIANKIHKNRGGSAMKKVLGNRY